MTDRPTYDELADWVRYEAQHAPGCYGWCPPHPCKCGLTELTVRLRLPEGNTDD